tara:strand:+ start:501 stop:776 length:276 start_codon:yes stop_codon:yes gene_type:complete
MSTTAPEVNNIVDFHEKRREHVIRALIETNRLPKEQIEKIIDMHNFLTDVDFRIKNDLVDKKTITNVEEEVSFVREKFNELFEMIKKELFI